MAAKVVIDKLDKKREYSRRELYEALCNDNGGYSYNSFNWFIQKLLSKGEIHKCGRDKYRVGRPEKKAYDPSFSEASNRIISFMSNSYPDAEYSLFETSMLNEFLNHQIAKNTIILYVEKELSEFVFRDFHSIAENNVLFRPTTDDLRKYWKPGAIIIVDRISEAPIGKNNKYDTPLEKLFVDLLSDKALIYMYSKNEYPDMLRIAYEKYYIDDNKLFRYAGRRGKRTEIKEILSEIGSNRH